VLLRACEEKRVKIDCDEVLECISRAYGLELDKLFIVLDHNTMQFYVEYEEDNDSES